MTEFLGAVPGAVILNLIQNLVLQSCLAAAQWDTGSSPVWRSFWGAAPCRHSELDSESGATKLLGCRPMRYRIKSGMTGFLGAVVPPRRHSELDSESGAAKLLGCRPLRYRIKSGMTDFLGRCPMLSFWAWFRIWRCEATWLTN